MSARTIADRLIDEATPLRLTLLVLLLRPSSAGAVRGLTWLVAGLAIVVPALVRAPLVWIALAALVGARLLLDWPLSDNHIYLLAYWCLGVGLCLMVDAPFTAMGDMSRRLVGSAFLCAIVWKGILAPDFLDARFFRVALVTDERFADLAQTVGGLTREDLETNREALVALPQGAALLDGPVLVEPPALRRLGLLLTWGGFVLEALVAIAFLSPRPAALHAQRHVLLIAFAALTYAAAPVAGFGWLLTAMGLAQCDQRHSMLRVAYVAAFALVLVYSETPLISRALTALRP